MFNIKSSLCLASAALLLIAVAPAAKALGGMPPTGNFVSVRVAGSHVAYGAILSPTRILVPAHVMGGSIGTYTILAGSADRTVTNCATCELRSVSSVARHPNFTQGTSYSNDVAIIHVTALAFNTNVYGSTIASSFSNAIGTQFTQIGYGNNGTNHNVLRTTATSPWTLATTSGYTYTPGDFVTASTDTTLNGMISYVFTANQTQVYTKLSDYLAWINAN